MSDYIYPLRLTALERRTFTRSAQAEGKKLAEWLRAAGRDRAQQVRARAACLDYPDLVELSAEAEANPKEFIQQKLKAKRELYS